MKEIHLRSLNCKITTRVNDVVHVLIFLSSLRNSQGGECFQRDKYIYEMAVSPSSQVSNGF